MRLGCHSWGVLLARGVAVNSPQYTGATPQQTIIWSKMSKVPKLRHGSVGIPRRDGSKLARLGGEKSLFMSFVMSLVPRIGSSCFVAPRGESGTTVWTEPQQRGSNFSCRGVLTGSCMRYKLTPAFWSSGHVHTTHVSIKPAQSQL